MAVNPEPLAGKVAIVTGGARGIGRSIALTLAQAGADVAITDLDVSHGADAVVEAIQGFGRRGRAYQSDASVFAQTQSVVEQIASDFGGIDILVNNAGITKDNLLLRMSEQEWDAVMSVNLKSVFNFSKACLKPLLNRKAGRIVNIASIVGVMGNAGQSNYSASKAGIIGFSKSMAKELASRNILVNAIAPGYVETPMTEKLNDVQRKALTDVIPLKRTCQPEEIANVVLFLAGPDSGYITGQVISVDGGLHM